MRQLRFIEQPEGRWINLNLAILLCNDVFPDLLCGTAKEFLNFNQLEIVILPGDTVFLNNVFDVLVFAAQGFDLVFQGHILFKRHMQQQQKFNFVGTVIGCGQDGNYKDAAVILATLADIDIALPDDNSLGTF